MSLSDEKPRSVAEHFPAQPKVFSSALKAGQCPPGQATYRPWWQRDLRPAGTRSARRLARQGVGTMWRRCGPSYLRLPHGERRLFKVLGALDVTRGLLAEARRPPALSREHATDDRDELVD